MTTSREAFEPLLPLVVVDITGGVENWSEAWAGTGIPELILLNIDTEGRDLTDLQYLLDELRHAKKEIAKRPGTNRVLMHLQSDIDDITSLIEDLEEQT